MPNIELDYMEYASNALAQAAYVSDAEIQYDNNFLLSGVSSASSSYNDSFSSSKAVDADLDTRWNTDGSVLPQWWKYDLGIGISKIVEKLRIYTFNDGSGALLKDFILYGSNNDSDWTEIYSGQTTNENGIWQEFTFSNSLSYRYYRVNIISNYRADNYSGFVEIEMMESLGRALQSYSESTIKTQGSYSLKGITLATTALNKTLTKTLSSPIDLSNIYSLKFDIRASRTGSNIKIGIHDVGGTITEITPNITDVNIWQMVNFDLSAVSNVNKDAIDKIIITIVNADAANTFYLDYLGFRITRPLPTFFRI